MVKLIRSYFSDNISDDNVVGCVFDWLDVRIHACPDINSLVKYGYCELLDKGCATHNHYFETNDFSVSWDIKSSYIEKGWSHFRVKNHKFYDLVGFNSVVDFVQVRCKSIFNCSVDDIIVTRLDFAFDFPTGSFTHNLIRDKFEHHSLDFEKYTEFHGKVGGRKYTNYSAGSRSSHVFLRLYYKSIENMSYRDGVPKKQYIYDWHSQFFGKNVDVVRFEVEFKPAQNFILDDLIYNYFNDFFDKYIGGCVVKLFLGEKYGSKIDNFNEKDRVTLIRLLKKLIYNNPNWDGEMSFSSYYETIEQAKDLCENLLNHKL